jgi:hypothetical protein
VTNATRDAYLDALAFSRAMLRGDVDGRTAVARSCDPVLMVDALASLYVGLVQTVTGTLVATDVALAYMLDHVDDLLPSHQDPT